MMVSCFSSDRQLLCIFCCFLLFYYGFLLFWFFLYKNQHQDKGALALALASSPASWFQQPSEFDARLLCGDPWCVVRERMLVLVLAGRRRHRTHHAPQLPPEVWEVLVAPLLM
jgi:hypothetical protein